MGGPRCERFRFNQSGADERGMRRRLTPALRGRLTRRAIAHSPHVWRVTGATFLVFALVHVAVALTVAEFDAPKLFLQAGLVGVLGLGVLLTRPPELGSPAAHVTVAAVYGSIATAVLAHAPYGAVALVSAMFIPLLIALWADDARAARLHLAAAAAALLAASVVSDDSGRTLVATVCALPGAAMMLVVAHAIFDAMEAQTVAMDRYARLDPITGYGNARMLEEELDAELQRQSGLAGRFALVDVQIEDFAGMETQIGHAAADAVITALGAGLSSAASTGATITRAEGSNFIVLLPGADDSAADAYVAAVRTAFPSALAGRPLQLAAGHATHPSDGLAAGELRDVARARRDLPSDLPPCGSDEIPPTWTVVLDQPEPVPVQALPRRVSRRDLATDPMAWRWISAMLLASGITIAIGTQLIGSATRWQELVAAVMVAVGAIRVLRRPPAVTSVWNHVFVALGYILPFCALWAAAPHAEWMIGAALFAPLGIVARLVHRPFIVAHLVAATLPALILALSGAVDHPSAVALMSLILVTWIVGASAAAIFGAADQQWAQVTDVVGRDPLTGAATAALFDERLAEEFERHRELQLAFLVIDLDLEGFEAFARVQGRQASTACLRSVYGAITAALGPDATVARIEGSRFRVLVPFAGLEDAERFIDAIEDEIERALDRPAVRRMRGGYAECVGGITDPLEAVQLASARRRELERAAA